MWPIEWIHSWLRKPVPYYRAVCFDESGFRFTAPNDEVTRVQWRDVCKVVAFKKDCVTFDEIWLDIQWGDPVQSLGVPEMSFEFRQLIEVLPRQIPGFPPAWIAEVSIPAFETNLTVLFERKTASLNVITPG